MDTTNRRNLIAQLLLAQETGIEAVHEVSRNIPEEDAALKEIGQIAALISGTLPFLINAEHTPTLPGRYVTLGDSLLQTLYHTDLGRAYSFIHAGIFHSYCSWGEVRTRFEQGLGALEHEWGAEADFLRRLALAHMHRCEFLPNMVHLMIPLCDTMRVKLDPDWPMLECMVLRRLAQLGQTRRVSERVVFVRGVFTSTKRTKRLKQRPLAELRELVATLQPNRS